MQTKKTLFSNVDTTKETINHLSLCSGYEGIGLGLRRIFPNVREICMVEREAFNVGNLVHKMQEGKLDQAPIWTDIRTFPFRKFCGLVDIASGGFPCQPFSSNSKRKSDRDERHLYPFIENGIRECRPSLVFLENVEGIITTKTSEGEPVLRYVLRSLEALDYICEAGIFSASEVGASHHRRRVFILAYSRRSTGTEGIKQAQLRTVRTSKPSLRSWLFCSEGEIQEGQKGGRETFPSSPQSPQKKWERLRTSKRRLGRANDGTSNRVDRLRTLGAGVVPQTAERAFRILSKKLIERIK